jgi:iron complex transport system ATP-binding protein
MARQTYAIVTCDLTVTRYDTHILRNVSCRIPAGVCTAILGPNGSGKTTFTRALTGQTFITAGSVSVLGETIDQTNVRALRQRIGLVNPTVGRHGAATVNDDLDAHEAVLTGFFGTIGLYHEVDAEQHRKADAALEQVGIAHRRDLRFALLSTGEQRRCLIARALVNRPDLLILDEPAAGMDITSREQVLATIEAIVDQPDPPTLLMITHHIEELSPRTAHVVLFSQGRIIASGKPDEVITSATLSRLYGCQVTVSKEYGRFWLRVTSGASQKLE